MLLPRIQNYLKRAVIILPHLLRKQLKKVSTLKLQTTHIKTFTK
jgi:hypothetical protein